MTSEQMTEFCDAVEVLRRRVLEVPGWTPPESAAIAACLCVERLRPLAVALIAEQPRSGIANVRGIVKHWQGQYLDAGDLDGEDLCVEIISYLGQLPPLPDHKPEVES